MSPDLGRRGERKGRRGRGEEGEGRDGGREEGGKGRGGGGSMDNFICCYIGFIVLPGCL